METPASPTTSLRAVRNPWLVGLWSAGVVGAILGTALVADANARLTAGTASGAEATLLTIGAPLVTASLLALVAAMTLHAARWSPAVSSAGGRDAPVE